jgi:hypothetical protein
MELFKSYRPMIFKQIIHAATFIQTQILYSIEMPIAIANAQLNHSIAESIK